MDRIVSTIFCDDIREEVGGKVSLIGTYGGDMLVPYFPAQILKFCLQVRVLTPADRPFESITAKVYLGDEVISESVAPPEALVVPSMPEGLPEGDDCKLVHSISFAFLFGPMVFEKPELIRVRVVTESEELRGQGLRIGLVPPELLANIK